MVLHQFFLAPLYMAIIMILYHITTLKPSVSIPISVIMWFFLDGFMCCWVHWTSSGDAWLDHRCRRVALYRFGLNDVIFAVFFSFCKVRMPNIGFMLYQFISEFPGSKQFRPVYEDLWRDLRLSIAEHLCKSGNE